MQTLRVTPVVGLPTFTGWSQIYLHSDRHWVCGFSLFGNNANNVGHDLVSFLSESHPNTAENFLSMLNEIEKMASEKETKLSMIGLFTTGNRAILAGIKANLWLKRKEKIGQIISFSDTLTLKEGSISLEDIFILLSQEAITFWGEIKQKLEQGYDLDTTVTSIVPGLHAMDDSSTCAIAFVQIADQTEVITDKNILPEIPISPVLENHQALPIALKPSVKPLNGFSQAIKSIFTKPGDLIKQYFGNLKQPRSRFKKPSKGLWIKILLFCLVLVGLTSWLVIIRTQAQEQRKAAQYVIDQMQVQIDQAQTMFADNPVAARSLVRDSLNVIVEQEKQFAQKKAGLKLLKQKEVEWEEFFTSISWKEESGDLVPFYDLRLAENDFIGRSSTIRSGTVFFLDPELKQILELQLSTKEVKRIDVSSLEYLKDIAILDKKVVVLANGIFEIQEDGTLGKIVEGDSTNQTAKFIETFDTTIYLFNSSERNIFRLGLDEDKKYSKATKWLKSVANVDFSSVVSMAIDGDIWLTTRDGGIFRFRSGQPSSFLPNGLPDPFQSTLLLRTNPDSENIYIVESDKERLVILKKDGTFLKQVTSKTLASVTNFVVDEEKGMVYLVSGSLVFDLQIK